MHSGGVCVCVCVCPVAGTSVLYNMTRLQKDNMFFMALGDTDELNANIGLAREHCSAETGDLNTQLIEIQSRLLDIGSVCLFVPI